jgi:hypothetical protein
MRNGAKELVCGANARGAGRLNIPSSVSNTPWDEAGGVESTSIASVVKIMLALRQAANFQRRFTTKRSPDTGVFFDAFFMVRS